MNCIKYVIEQFDIKEVNCIKENCYEIIDNNNESIYIFDKGYIGYVSKSYCSGIKYLFNNGKELTIALLENIELSLKPEIYEQMKIKEDLFDLNNINHIMKNLFELPIRFTGKKNKIDIMLNNKRIGSIENNKELPISIMSGRIEVWFNKIEQLIGYLMVNSKIINDYSLQY